MSEKYIEYIKSHRSEIFICILLAAVIFVVFGQGINHEFVNFDDDTYVTSNAQIHSGLTAANIKWAFTTTYANFWHPLTWLSHLVDCELFGLKAGMHHLTNILIHIASTVILFLLLFRATGSKWASAACAALFAIHPLHVESVAWIAERKDTLSTFFWMLTMWCYVWYVEKPNIKRYLLIICAFIAGLMAKPMLVTLPFVLLLFDWWPLSRIKFDRVTDLYFDKQKRAQVLKLVLEKIPLLILAIAASAVAYVAQEKGGALGSLGDYPFGVRMANAFVSYVDYIGKTFLPVGLAVPYPHPGALPLWQTAGACFFLIAITLLVFHRAFKYPYLVIGWLWFIGTLVPVIGLIQLGAHGMADRYTYVPLVGLFIIFAWGAADILKKLQDVKKKVLACLSVGIIFVSLVIIARHQAGYWENSIKLFEHSLDVNYKNLAAHNNIGTALLGQGKTKEAEFHFGESLKLNPRNSIVFHNIGFSLFKQGNKEQAAKYYIKALQVNPRQVQTHRKLADLLLDHGNSGGAEKHYKEVLKVRPNDVDVLSNAGTAVLRQGRANESIMYFARAHKLRSNYVTNYNMGSAMLEAGRLDEAIGYFAESLRFNPYSEMTHNNLANALARQGKPEEAVMHYSEAIRINPDLVSAHNNMGIILKRLGRNEEAAVQFSEVLRIDPEDKKARSNLELLRK